MSVPIVYILLPKLFPFSISSHLCSKLSRSLWTLTVFQYFGKSAPDLNLISMLFLSSLWSLRKTVNTAFHRRGLFVYPTCNAVLHHWHVYGFQTSFATAWFLFAKLSYKNILQNTRRKPCKAVMKCICDSPPSQDLLFCPWKHEEWFEIICLRDTCINCSCNPYRR